MACSVLDINDYNDNFTGSDHSDSPGKRWATTGPRLLLGYNLTAPSDRLGGIDILNDLMYWLSNPVGKDIYLTRAEAWMRSNQAHNAWYACAIDLTGGENSGEYHYFYYKKIFGIPYSTLWITVPESNW